MIGNSALEDITRTVAAQVMRDSEALPNWLGRCASTVPRRQNSSAPIRLARAARKNALLSG